LRYRRDVEPHGIVIVLGKGDARPIPGDWTVRCSPGIDRDLSFRHGFLCRGPGPIRIEQPADRPRMPPSGAADRILTKTRCGMWCVHVHWGMYYSSRCGAPECDERIGMVARARGRACGLASWPLTPTHADVLGGWLFRAGLAMSRADAISRRTSPAQVRNHAADGSFQAPVRQLHPAGPAGGANPSFIVPRHGFSPPNNQSTSANMNYMAGHATYPSPPWVEALFVMPEEY